MQVGGLVPPIPASGLHKIIRWLVEDSSGAVQIEKDASLIPFPAPGTAPRQGPQLVSRHWRLRDATCTITGEPALRTKVSKRMLTNSQN